MVEVNIEELYDKQYDYFEGCLDKLYSYFLDYGYTWLDETVPPGRLQIKNSIVEMMPDAICSGMVASGRIAVEYDPSLESFKIYLEL